MNGGSAPYVSNENYVRIGATFIGGGIIASTACNAFTSNSSWVIALFLIGGLIGGMISRKAISNE